MVLVVMLNCAMSTFFHVILYDLMGGAKTRSPRGSSGWVPAGVRH